MPSHYLNQYWVIINWTLRNKLQWKSNLLNSNQNRKFFIQDNASENVICEMAAILSRGRQVYAYFPYIQQANIANKSLLWRLRWSLWDWKRQERKKNYVNTWYEPWSMQPLTISTFTTQAMVSWWLHDMETLSVLLALCERNPLVTSVFLSNGQKWGPLMFSFLLAWTRYSTNN